jgi:hypothetical protein
MEKLKQRLAIGLFSVVLFIGTIIFLSLETIINNLIF